MFVLATASADFVQNWSQIVGDRAPVVRVESIPALQSFLSVNPVQMIVLDMTLEGGKEPQIIRAISEMSKPARLVLAGISFSPSAELAGLAVGAVACCSPALSIAECQRIIEVVLQGGVWLSHAGIPALVDKLRHFSEQKAEQTAESVSEQVYADEALQKLTKREREVAQLIGNGATNKEIAKRLFISDRTVKAHLSTIFEKLHVHDRLQLALIVSGRSHSSDGGGDRVSA